MSINPIITDADRAAWTKAHLPMTTLPDHTFIVTTETPAEHTQVVQRLLQLGGRCDNGLDAEGRFCTSNWGSESSHSEYPHLFVRAGRPFLIESYRMGRDLRNLAHPAMTAPSFLSTYGDGVNTTVGAMITPSTMTTTLSITQDLLIICPTREGHQQVVDRLHALGVSYSPGVTTLRPFDSAPNVAVYAHPNPTFQTVDRSTPIADDVVHSPSTFLQAYPAPGGAAVRATPPAKTTEVNPPNFVITGCGDPILGEAAQRALFKAGLRWGAGPTVMDLSSWPYINVYRDGRYAVMITRSAEDANPGFPHYDVGTQLREIVQLLATPPKPPAPVGPHLHGYTGVYRKDTSYVTFGCANLCTGLLHRVLALNEAGITGNRKVASVTLDSGKTLTLKQIEETLAYVAAVDSYLG